MKIVLTGGAGLVGQNLVVRLEAQGYRDIVVIDKHRGNLEVLQRLQPQVTAVHADLAEAGDWRDHFVGAGRVVMLQAQIGGKDHQAFVRNNLDATRNVLEAIRACAVPGLVHVSSSVVGSVADDSYSRTKRLQEQMVLESGIPCPVLRPTLMFGWFDRKHLGWLARLMKRVPVFPIPGHGRYMRQPLYVGDFAHILIRCIERPVRAGIYNISGHERIDYIDIIRQIRRATRAKTLILPIPLRLFDVLLRAWGLFDRDPPFTPQQLRALCARDEFEVMDWPGLFGVPCTPFATAVDETFNDPRYGRVVLAF